MPTCNSNLPTRSLCLAAEYQTDAILTIDHIRQTDRLLDRVAGGDPEDLLVDDVDTVARLAARR